MPKHAPQTTALLIMLVGLLLSACGGPATQVPTAAPTAAPTEALVMVPTPIALPTPQASPEVAGVGDAYFPLQGNPGYDAQHYTLEIAVDSANLNQITGTATMEALAQNDLPSFNMDFLGLEVSAVAVDDRPASFSRDGQELTITPATPIAAGATFKAAVTYAGVPQLYQDPAFHLFVPANADPPRTGWKERDKGYSAVLSQPDGAMTWFPSNNTPRDKATYTFRVTEVITTTLDGQDLFLATFLSFYNNKAAARLPLLITQSARTGDVAWVAEAVTPAVSPDAEAMYAAVLCARTGSAQFDATTLLDPPYTQLASFGPDEAARIRRQCEVLSVEAEAPFVLDHRDTPTLLLNGTRDQVMPLPYGKWVAESLLTAYLVTVPGSAHGSLLQNACLNQIVLAFLAEPGQAPDTSCMAERQPPFTYP